MAAIEEGVTYEFQAKGITADLDEILNRMGLAGWEHYDTMAGCVDGDRWMPVGCTLFFKRPMGGVRKKPAQPAAKGGGK